MYLGYGAGVISSTVCGHGFAQRAKKQRSCLKFTNLVFYNIKYNQIMIALQKIGDWNVANTANISVARTDQSTVFCAQKVLPLAYGAEKT